MAQLAIKGELSGAITLTVPDNAGSATLELPTTGTSLLSNTSDIPAANITGLITGSQIIEGAVGAKDDVFWENKRTITENYTIANGRNAMTAGPITIGTNVDIVVSDNAAWTIV